ncbi:hypothetical protein [Mycolicibacterium helvum]|uniref:Uncharacterized protein n=1 Tax=Mycolicibacterium helvum TaxID=1534349 RepID=A0A7I7T1V0_9MYCO|nr:hypothetical protein [Mycolicibacterium helvum]BBY62195.1 hypothetical protein MHEL_04380 [Mycolicibacterium helvum]
MSSADDTKPPLRSVMQPVGDDWVVVMEWPDGVTDGGPSRLVIEPIDKMPVGGLSSTVLRHIDFRSAIDNFRDQIAQSSARGSFDMNALYAFDREQLRSALREGVTREYLALLASHYVWAVDRGQANINDFLAELVGRPVGTVRGHLIRARHEGLLSGSHGKKGGELSDEAEELVEPFALARIDEIGRLDSLRRRHSKKAITPRTET